MLNDMALRKRLNACQAANSLDQVNCTHGAVVQVWKHGGQRHLGAEHVQDGL